MKHGRVHAIAFVCRGWAIIEYMAEVRIATTASHLSTHHAKTLVGVIKHATGANTFEKAGPSAGAGELGIGPKKRVATGSTVIGAHTLEIPQRTGECPLGTLLTGNMINFGRQYLSPFGIGKFQTGSVGSGIVGIFSCFHRKSIGMNHFPVITGEQQGKDEDDWPGEHSHLKQVIPPQCFAGKQFQLGSI